ncbi:MAG: flagellar motor switch protein FliG [Ruminococcus sp.]|jgi:flagellar motor switch protein FliG|uniref:Flagellar motor switch protein FliG n=1 Tax=Schaedlerella arabinosiphila TaxID=2044587 RepID=N2AAX2_9FIRM|nr:flagellar motor switch protein FliG [Schaedlerella arabinosiphila]MCI8723493.1 flagellar motor switch protein FliG [Ruminococcus sp.]KAI4441797.1 Flagellar motor switch protein FliG [Schaedlerella arabinosiphila]MCI9603174.1 flagellar motor switch protein FliG [Ruminococcus sp.]MCI9631915.1 flagellar motor switch protein FliG [Ruminococcus sp.]NDO68742.1 flagellar motor switch protein FliG [Schaedlerella arabinosiphila]
MEANIASLTPEQKAAAVVVSLGADKASKIYKHLSESDIERLTIEVAKLGHVTPEQMEAVLDEFYKTCLTQKVVTDGGMEYARAVLEKAFGESTAQTLLDKLAKSMKTRPFEFIRKSDVKNLFSFLQHERPQTIALILSYADPDQASFVISELPKEKQIKVVEAIAKMESASPEAIKIVEASLKKRFESVLTTADFTTIGGIDYIAEVMNNMDRANEKFIFDELGKENEELADTIRKKMFVFEDIVSMDNRSIQRFIRECDVKDIVYALKGSDQNIKDLVFANVSSRMAESIQSDLEVTVNVRLRDVEEAQQRIVAVIRRLEEAGELIIVKSGKDEIIA